MVISSKQIMDALVQVNPDSTLMSKTNVYVLILRCLSEGQVEVEAVDHLPLAMFKTYRDPSNRWRLKVRRSMLQELLAELNKNFLFFKQPEVTQAYTKLRHLLRREGQQQNELP